MYVHLDKDWLQLLPDDAARERYYVAQWKLAVEEELRCDPSFVPPFYPTTGKLVLGEGDDD